MSHEPGTLVVFSAPAAGVSDEEYHRWYDGTHVPELIEYVDGIVSCRRFSLAPAQSPGAPEGRPFLAIYELDRPAAEVLANMTTALPRLTMSSTLNMAELRPIMWAYDAL